MRAVQYTLLMLVIVSSCLGTLPARGEDTVATAIQEILDQVQPFLKTKKFSIISVGGFTSIAGTSAGPEIQMKFASAIGEIDGLKLDAIEYDIKISGRLELVEHVKLDSNENPMLKDGKELKTLAVKIVAQLFDEHNRPIGQFTGDSAEISAEITGQEAIPRLLGITSNSGGEDSAHRDEKFQQDIDKDPCVFKRFEIFAETDSDYSIEVLVKQDDAYQAIEPSKQGRRGNAFAEISHGKVFAIRLNNYSTQEAAVNLTLDGISSFAFSDVRAETVYWLVPPAKAGKPGSTLIRGWDKNDEESFEFKSVGYPDSAAKRLNIEPNDAIGQICAQFSVALPSTGAGRSAGIGDIIKDRKQSVPRDIGNLQTTIHVRYERKLEE